MVFSPKPEMKCFLIAKGLRPRVKSPSTERNPGARSVLRKHWPRARRAPGTALRALREFGDSAPTSVLWRRDCCCPSFTQEETGTHVEWLARGHKTKKNLKFKWSDAEAWDLNVQNWCQKGTRPAKWQFTFVLRNEIRTKVDLRFVHRGPRRQRPGALCHVGALKGTCWPADPSQNNQPWALDVSSDDLTSWATDYLKIWVKNCCNFPVIRKTHMRFGNGATFKIKLVHPHTRKTKLLFFPIKL